MPFQQLSSADRPGAEVAGLAAAAAATLGHCSIPFCFFARGSLASLMHSGPATDDKTENTQLTLGFRVRGLGFRV